MMNTSKIAKRFLALVLTLCLGHIPEIASAEVLDQMIPTQAVVDSLSRTELEAKVQGYLNRDDLKDQLRKLGVSPEETSQRVANLSDSELNDLAKQMDQGRYGGDIVGILVIALVVILIIYFAKRI
jgi:HAMP domain-containing protein